MMYSPAVLNTLFVLAQKIRKENEISTYMN